MNAVETIRFYTLLAIASLITGCGLYLHDEVAASRATAVRDAWGKVNAEPTVKIEVRNLDLVAQEQQKVVADQARINLSLALQQLPTKRWISSNAPYESAAVEDEVLLLLKRNIEAFGVETEAVSPREENRAKLAKSFVAAQKALAQAVASVDTEKKKYSSKIAEEELAIAVRKSTDENAKKAYGDLQDATKERDLKKIREREATFAEEVSKGTDTDLKTSHRNYIEARKKAPAIRDLNEIVTELRAATEKVKKDIPLNISAAKIVSETFKNTSTNLQKLGIIVSRLEEERQPGLKLVLLGFAVDVATAERDRLAMQLAHTEEMVNLAIRRKERLIRVVTDAAAILNYVHGTLDYVYSELLLSKSMEESDIEKVVGSGVNKTVCGKPNIDETVLATLKRWARDVHRSRSLDATMTPPAGCADMDTGIENQMLALLRYASLAGYQNYYERLERHEAAIAAHRAVRQEDMINAREREQLISRSLDGLALFYQGGITKEDVARLAAIIEGASIAVGVNR